MSLIPLLAFFAGAGFTALASRLRDFTTGPPRGLSDLIPWALLIETGPNAAVLNKDGSLTAAFHLTGPDRASSIPEELAFLSDHTSRALSGFPNWTFHCDAIREAALDYPGPGAYPDPVTALLDEVRRQSYLARGQQYHSRVVLSVTYRPPRASYRRLTNWLQVGAVPSETTSPGLETLLSFFQDSLSILADRLSAVLRVRRLDGPALLGHLHGCLTTDFLPLSPSHTYLDLVFGTHHFVGGWEPQIGSQHLRCLAVCDLPSSTTPALLDELQTLSFPYRFSIRFTPLSAHETTRIMNRYALGWDWSGTSATDLVRPGAPSADRENRHGAAMLDEIADARRLAVAGDSAFCYLTATLLVAAPTRSQVEERVRQLDKFFRDRGIPTRLETINSVSAFHGSLPGVTAANLRVPLVHAPVIADLLPLTSVFPGLTTNPSRFFPEGSPPLLMAHGPGGTPFRLHLHHQDVGHTLVVGRTGSGKSILLQALWTNFLRYPNSRVVFFDHDYSSRVLAEATGADYYDLGADSSISLQPLHRAHEAAQRPLLAAWLETLFRQSLPPLTAQQRSDLLTGLELVGSLNPKLRTLTSLRSILQDPDLSRALAPYTDSGPYAAYLDGDHDSLRLARVVVFETRRILELPAAIQIPLISYLLTEVEAGLDGRPTLISLDEAGVVLLNDAFSDRIQTWLLKLRKKNTAVVLAFQHLHQLRSESASTAFSTLLTSCTTRIFLPNPAAVSPETRPLYESFGLLPGQIELLARAQPKRDYLFVNPDGCRLFDLGLAPTELAFYSTPTGLSLAETHRQAAELRAQVGSTWPVAWLHQLGLTPEAHCLANLFSETPS